VVTRRAIIWADSGPGVGLGHIARCCAVAPELARRGLDVQVVTPGADGARAARDAGVTVAVADRLAAACPGGGGLAIVDSYRVTPAEIEGLRSHGTYVVAFDDTADHVLPADVVINAAPGADAVHYEQQPGRHYLLGAAYFPLRAAFRAAPVKTIRDVVEMVLVTVGGEDVHGLLEGFMTLAAAVCERARIVGVVGAALAATGGDRAAASRPSDRCEVKYGPADYADLVCEADVIVCGGGQSLIEAVAAGTPAAAVLLGDDQRPQRAAVIAAGAAVDGGDWRLAARERDARLRDALALLRPADRRAWLSARGRSLVDGLGAERIADAILRLWQPA
jgi:UDP-2,4-diacetamido-2,4,6-trideoxy-beta-L-altropyranose hydrolase